MFSIENIILLTVSAILLINFQTIVTSIITFFQELQEPKIDIIDKDEIDQSVYEVIRPYDALLLSLGFEYRSQIVMSNLLKKYTTPQYAFYYYHPLKGVHASITTTPFKGSLSGATISYDSIYESYFMTTSYDCFAHNIMANPDNSYSFDYYYGSFEKAFEQHLIDREIEGEVVSYQEFNQEGFANYAGYISTQMIEKAVDMNILHFTKNGYRFSASLAFVKYMNHIVKGYKRAKEAIKDSINRVQVDKRTLYSNTEAYILAQQLDEKPIESSQSSKIKIFLISAVTFVMFFGLIGIPWSVLPMIVVVLLIHELGHFWTMRYFGYQDTSIFFIPLFGAAAKGEKDNATPFEEYLVSLAGPLPGIIIAIAIGFMMFSNPELRENELLKDYAMMSLFLNYINLLPIFPLDGGKIVQTLLFTRYPMAQFYFFLVSILVIIFAALMLKSILLGIFALLLIFSLNNHYSTSKLIKEIMNQNSDNPFKQRVIERLSSDGKYIGEELITKVGMAKRALKILNANKPTPILMLFGLGFYLLIVLAPLIVPMLLPPLGIG